MKFALKMLSTVAIAILPLLAEAGAVDQLHQFLNSTRTLGKKQKQANELLEHHHGERLDIGTTGEAIANGNRGNSQSGQ